MSRLLVTGGAGFIGSHLVRTLVQRKHFVRVLDNFISGKKENLSSVISKIDLMHADIRDRQACIKAVKGIDYVFHEAALRSVPKSMENPDEYSEVNIDGTLNILEASKNAKVKCLAFASSSSVYGDTDTFPQKESLQANPISPYALTKLTGEHYCKIFSRNFNLPTVCLRYFNVFGPGQALDDEYAVVIPKFISCILNGKRPPIFGNGKQSRDFTFVQDVVEANILAINKKNLKGEVFNVASGKDYRVIDLVRIINSIMKTNIKPEFRSPRRGDIFRTLADISKSKKYLGIKAHTDFVEGLKLTIDYFRSQND